MSFTFPGVEGGVATSPVSCGDHQDAIRSMFGFAVRIDSAAFHFLVRKEKK